MFQRMLLGTVAVVVMSAAVCRAEPKDDLQAAADKLAGSANYSWTSTTEGGFGGAGPTTGKTEKDGYTMVSLPAMNETFEVIMKGKNAVIKGASGWQTAEELQAAAAGAGGFSPQTVVVGTVQTFQAPAAQIGDVAKKLTNVKKTADGFTADYVEASAKEMLAFRGRGRGGAGAAAPEIANPKGTLAVTLKEGVPAKVVIHVTGNISFNGNDRAIDRTTTTEIKDVGTTKVAVPEEAKKKLDAAPAATQAK